MEHTLSELQKRLLSMLEWYHNFCVKHNLKYYLQGGTMLGAARHQGFIPWDDDVDVGMPRKDYEKFLELTNGTNNQNFVVENCKNCGFDFFYGYSKIYDTTTTLIEHTKHNIKRGIYIDVFPLDGAGMNEKECHAFYSKVSAKYRLLLARTCAIRQGRKWYKNVAIYAARMIPDLFLNNTKLMQRIDALCKTKDYNSCSYIGNLYGNWGDREIVPKTIMGEPTLYNFENLKVYGPADFDGYLTSLYGDWKKLPPKEKQITHHDYLECNLHKSYLEE